MRIIFGNDGKRPGLIRKRGLLQNNLPISVDAQPDLQQIVKMKIQYRLILLIISVSPDPCISIQSQHRLPVRNLIISEFHISFLSCHTARLSLLTQHKGTL